jgi:branched-subunit amino acid aminotransferase/4-amino-4-deoxychorismate lyase
MAEALAYLNGQVLPVSQARLPVYDAGVVQGVAVAEQCRTFKLRPFRLDEHLDRLFRSLRYLELDIGLKNEDLADISEQLVAHNGKLLDAGDELGVIQFVTPGPYPTYAGMSEPSARPLPTVCVHTFRLPFELWSDKMQEGARLETPTTRHVPPDCYSPQVKHRSRLHFYLAEREVRLHDPQALALLLDVNGNVTETNGANFLMVERGAIVSPTTRNILPGVSRNVVREIAEKLGIPFSERDVSVAAAITADEALLTSTPYCVMPVSSINGRDIGDGKPGPVFQRLLQSWSEEVGVDIKQQIVDSAKRGKAQER